MQARKAFEQAATSVLRRVAAAHGIALDETAIRGEIVERLAERFADADYLAIQVDALGNHERRALLAARAGAGEIRGYLLSRLLGSDDPEATRPLLDRGFLFRTFAPLGPHRGEVFAVPDEVLALLGGEDLAESSTAALPEAVAAPQREERRQSDPAFSLFTLASFLRRHPHEPDSAGARASLLRQETAGWTEEPGGWPWSERWAFVRALGLGAGLLERRGEGIAVAGTIGEALTHRARLVRRLWRTYLAARDWSEIERAGVPHGELLAEQVDAPSARAAVLRSLGKLPAGEWFSLPDLLAFFERAIPTFLREQLDTRSAALTDPATGQPLLAAGSWERVEAPLLRYLLLGPLYWLGAVATDAAGERVSLTAVGAALLDPSADLPTRTPEPAAWDGDDLRLPARADLGLALRAERYLALVERRPVSRYRLDGSRLVEALAAGGTAEECREVLRDLTGDLPEAVTAHLADLERKAGALSLRPAVLLEARAPEDLEAARAAKGVAHFLRRQLSPTVAEIPASHAEEVAEALRAAGQMPHLDAALRLMAGRRAYAALVDEHVLEFLLVALLALQATRPEQLTRLEGAPGLIERLQDVFSTEQLRQIEAAADALAGDLRSAAAPRARARPRGRRRR